MNETLGPFTVPSKKTDCTLASSMSYNKNSYVVRYTKYHGIQKGLFSEKILWFVRFRTSTSSEKKVGEM